MQSTICPKPGRWWYLAAVGFSLVLAAIPVGAQERVEPSPAADTAGALGLVTGYVTAWNVHDMNALASLFSETADFVNPFGAWASGRTAIEEEHTNRHNTLFQTSTMKADTMTIKFVSPEVAVVHFQWTVSGWKKPDGSTGEPFHGITTFVSRLGGGRWQVESGQVTIIAPEGILPAVVARGNR